MLREEGAEHTVYNDCHDSRFAAQSSGTGRGQDIVMGSDRVALEKVPAQSLARVSSIQKLHGSVRLLRASWPMRNGNMAGEGHRGC
jgi:hypothetical protein